MDNYTKSDTVELEPCLPFPEELVADIPVMKIREGTKIHNITTYVHRSFQNDKTRRVVFSGIGNACTKVVSCCEVFKREHRGELYQLSKICYKRIEEYWEPQVAGLERCQNSREINPRWMQRESKGVRSKRRPKKPNGAQAGGSERWKRPKKPKNSQEQSASAKSVE